MFIHFNQYRKIQKDPKLLAEDNERVKKNAVIATITAPLAQCADDVEEAYNEYKVYIELSKTLSNVSKKARKDTKTNAGLDKLQEQLKDAEFHAGRGAKKLPGTKTVYYMRSGGQARLFFRYSEKERLIKI